MLLSCHISFIYSYLLSNFASFLFRLSGAALVVPVANFWWPSVPPSLSKETLSSLPLRDQWALQVAHYTPWLFNWWLTQKWFPSFSILEPNSPLFSNSDVEIFKDLLNIVSPLQVNNLQDIDTNFCTNSVG